MFEEEKCCGECRHKFFDYNTGDWMCGCEESDRCGENVAYDENCDEWEDWEND